MNASITPAALEALAHEYDELGFEVELIRSDLGTAVSLEYCEARGNGWVRWRTIFADEAEVDDADKAARYRDEIDGEVDSAWRSQ